MSNDNNVTLIVKKNIYECCYCNKNFGRLDNLNVHIKEYCKVKKVETTNLMELTSKVTSYKQLLLKNNTETKNISNLNNTINKIQTNIYAFGKENIDKLDIFEAMSVYLKSKKENIIPNMFRYINLNDKYPENHNVVITDDPKELVKIYDGEKILLKKFENVKVEIKNKVIQNINNIVDKFKKSNYKKSKYVEEKIYTNDLFLRVINGELLCVSDSDI